VGQLQVAVHDVPSSYAIVQVPISGTTALTAPSVDAPVHELCILRIALPSLTLSLNNHASSTSEVCDPPARFSSPAVNCDKWMALVDYQGHEPFVFEDPSNNIMVR
jgi:hypothetical protein